MQCKPLILVYTHFFCPRLQKENIIIFGDIKINLII